MHDNMEGDIPGTARMYTSVHESGQCAPFNTACSSLVAQLCGDHEAQKSLVLVLEPQLHRYLLPNKELVFYTRQDNNQLTASVYCDTIAITFWSFAALSHAFINSSAHGVHRR